MCRVREAPPLSPPGLRRVLLAGGHVARGLRARADPQLDRGQPRVHPGFKAELPYVLVTVDLEEGVRMIAQLRGVAPAAIRIGLPVEVAFERATDELTLPVFRAAP